jgi:hypothetical protein
MNIEIGALIPDLTSNYILIIVRCRMIIHADARRLRHSET